jgi:zinc transport system substrate-binding protein
LYFSHGEVGTPELLLSGRNSEHTASLSPQQISDLGKADVVFMIGSGLEHKLGQMNGSEAVSGKKFTSLSEATGIKTLAVRQGGAFEAHEEEEHEGEEHDGALLKFDPHVWLDPENVKVMTNAIATELSKIDPEHAKSYETNAATYIISLNQLTAEIRAETKPIQNPSLFSMMLTNIFRDSPHCCRRHSDVSAAASASA